MNLLAQEAAANTTTLFTAVSAVATVFGGAIAVLWRVIESHQRVMKSRAERLEGENTTLNSDMQDIKHKVGVLEGRQQGIEDTCELTLQAVRDAIRQAGENDSENR